MQNFFNFYMTPRMLKVRDRGLVAVHRGIQLALLAFIFLFYIWWNRGYQEESDFAGVVSVKVQGGGFAGDRATCPEGYDWPQCGPYDAIDVVQPSQQRGAVFITTSMATTPNQTRGTCASQVACTSAADCIEGDKNNAGSSASGNEYLTGECDLAVGTCLQAAWCPAELPSAQLEKHPLYDVANMTIFFRVDGTFLDFPDQGLDSGSNLSFNYNLFYLSDILAFANGAPRPEPTGTAAPNDRAPLDAFNDVVDNGAVIVLTAKVRQKPDWLHPDEVIPCNLDLDDWNKTCLIDLSFERVDPVDTNSVSFGYNFRYATPTSLALPNSATRSVTKVWGIRIAFQVRGTGGRFDFMTLVITFAAAIAIMKVASSVADVVMQHLCRNKPWAKPAMKAKIVVVSPSDEKSGKKSSGLIMTQLQAEDGLLSDGEDAL